MSSGQSLRNGNSVEPGLPNTFLMPNARSRSKVACLTVRGEEVFAGLRGNVSPRHCEERSDEAIQNIFQGSNSGLLRFARNDGDSLHHVAVPFMVGAPCVFAVQVSSPPSTSLALTENSPSNSGCRPRYTNFFGTRPRNLAANSIRSDACSGPWKMRPG